MNTLEPRNDTDADGAGGGGAGTAGFSAYTAGLLADAAAYALGDIVYRVVERYGDYDAFDVPSQIVIGLRDDLWLLWADEEALRDEMVGLGGMVGGEVGADVDTSERASRAGAWRRLAAVDVFLTRNLRVLARGWSGPLRRSWVVRAPGDAFGELAAALREAVDRAHRDWPVDLLSRPDDAQRVAEARAVNDASSLFDPADAGGPPAGEAGPDPSGSR